MSKNLIASKTKKSDKIYTMAKPEFAFTGSKNMFKGVEPQGDYTNISKTANINMTINPAQFYSPELTPETWLLPKSRLEILKWPLLAGELVFGNNRFLPIEDLKIGDYVLSKNGTYQKVVGVMSKDPDSTGVAITARYCPTVQFGGNHPILAIDTDKGSASKTDIYRKSLYAGFIKFETESKWYAAKDIKPGFIVAVPKFKVEKTPTIDLAPYVPQCQHGYKYEIQDNIIKVKSFGNINFDMPRFLPLEEDLFTFLGWYVAEGHIHNATILTCCFDEEDVIKSLQETLNTYLHIPFEKMPCKPHNGSLRLIIYNKILNNFLEDSFNTGARNKDIPQWLLEAPINLVQAFLRGWIKGDGYIKPMSGTKSKGFSVCTVSEQLALKGHMLFNKVGAIATFRKREQSIEKISGLIKGKVKSVAPFTYTLEVGGQRLKKVFPDFETYEKGCPNYFEDENFFYTSVTNVELFDTDKKFYCITTEDHTIQVPFVTHNCRIYFNLDPYIQSILTMHSQYPISEFRLQHKDKETEDFFNRKMFEDCHIDWVSFFERLSLSYYVYGEGIVWGAWNSIKGTWDDLILIDPALIDYQEDALTGKSIMSLIPTQELKQLVAQSLKEGSTDLPADYIACVQDNKQIPLDTEGVEPNYLTGRKYVPPTAFMFSRLLSPGSTRGVPIIQQLFKCVTGDTKVALLDGTNPTIKELAESGRKDFWVYGADKDGNIVPAKAECAAYIKDEETVEVLLDNGSKIRCTKDHPFFLRDMTRVEAKDLKPGDILKGRIKDSKVVSVAYTGKVEPVYCVANAGVNHNFMIALDDGSGVLSGNTLIYADKIRLAQVAAADSFYNPIQLWTIGSFTGDPKTSVIPTEADLQQYRDMIQQATMTPPFSIYVPPFVKYEALGVQGKLLSVYEDLGYVENCIFVGLGVNKNLVLGSGPSFSSGKQISLYRLIKMYKSFRLKLEAFIKKYIILPIAKAADIRDEHSNYIIPDIKWAESLQPEQDKDLFDSLFKLYDKGLVSTQTLMEHFMIPLDMKLESERLLAERLTVFDKATDRLGGKVFREDMKNLDKSKLGGSSSPKMSDSLSGGSSGAGPSAGGEKPEGGAPGTAESDKSYLPPPISGGPEEAKETPAE